MKKYIKPSITQMMIQLEGMVCESTTVDTTKTVDSSDIDSNENNIGGGSLWDDED